MLLVNSHGCILFSVVTSEDGSTRGSLRSRSDTGKPVNGQQPEANQRGDAQEELEEGMKETTPRRGAIVLQPDIVIEEVHQYSESEDDTLPHSEGEDEQSEDEPAAEIPLLRPEHGNDPQLKCLTLTLISSCALNHCKFSKFFGYSYCS